jgi:hypothetical protein
MKQQRSSLGEMFAEVGVGLKDLGRDVVKGVTRLPYELIFGTWGQEWLETKTPDKPPVSKKVGKSTPFDAESLLLKAEGSRKESSLQAIRQRLSSQFIQSHQPEKTQQGDDVPAKKPRYISPLPDTGFARKRGDWMHGTKRKRSPTPTDLNRTEFTGNKGSQ